MFQKEKENKRQGKKGKKLVRIIFNVWITRKLKENEKKTEHTKF